MESTIEKLMHVQCAFVQIHEMHVLSLLIYDLYSFGSFGAGQCRLKVGHNLRISV